MCSCNLTQYLADIQNNLSKKIIDQDSFKDVQKIVGVDISFSKDNFAIAAAVVINLDDMEVLNEKTLKVELLFHYIPGFLGFRESSGIISVLKNLDNEFDILMVNGHGIMHPRGFGLASHVGLLLDVPTIGVAKRLTYGNYKSRDNNSLKIIEFMNKPVGACDKRKCISIGHKISLKTALEVVQKTTVYKMPEPIRQAHILATEAMKDNLNKKMIDF